MLALKAAAEDGSFAAAADVPEQRPLILQPARVHTPRGRRSSSRTPEGSAAMGSTPSLPPGTDRRMCLASPM
jgi:hypothetical protein